jgi:peptidoglycan hydrolase CwlO-like protein
MCYHFNMIKSKDAKIKITPIVPIEEKISKGVGSVMSLYIHTALFVISFLLILLGISTEKVLLILTTLVSLEAIYLAIFIQMTVNRNTESLEEVEEDLGDIQENIEDIQEDVDEIQEDIDDIEEDVDEGSKRDVQVDNKFKNINDQLAIILQEIKNIKNNN